MKKQKSKSKLLIPQKAKFAKQQIAKPNQKAIKGGTTQVLMLDIVEEEGTV